MRLCSPFRLRWFLLALALLGGLQRGLLPANAAMPMAGDAAAAMLFCHPGSGAPGDPQHPPLPGEDCDGACCNGLPGLDLALPAARISGLPLARQIEAPRASGWRPLVLRRWRHREPPGQAPPRLPA